MNLIDPQLHSADPMKNWGEATWTLPKIVKLLVVDDYRDELLLGLIMSIGSRGEGAVSHRNFQWVCRRLTPHRPIQLLRDSWNMQALCRPMTAQKVYSHLQATSLLWPRRM